MNTITINFSDSTDVILKDAVIAVRFHGVIVHAEPMVYSPEEYNIGELLEKGRYWETLTRSKLKNDTEYAKQFFGKI